MRYDPFTIDTQRLNTNNLLLEFQHAGLEARGAVPTALDPLGEVLSLKNISKKLVRVDRAGKTVLFLEPGEAVNLVYCDDIRAIALNNGV